MLVHGLKGFSGSAIRVPDAPAMRSRRDHLENSEDEIAKWWRRMRDHESTGSEVREKLPQ